MVKLFPEMSRFVETFVKFMKNIIPRKKVICRKSILATAKYSRHIPFISNQWIVEVDYYDDYKKLRAKKYYYRDEMEATRGEIILRSFSGLCQKCYKQGWNHYDECSVCNIEIHENKK